MELRSNVEKEGVVLLLGVVREKSLKRFVNKRRDTYKNELDGVRGWFVKVK